ncbi:MAG: hypothetical protein K0S65_2542 [Labilithrix sp.]|jgi:hypothetical protein|nr:hypothetical protein [Labilithrix sp.]
MSSAKQKVAVVGALALVGLGLTGALRHHRDAVSEPVRSAAKDPRQVLGRPWFDHAPKSRNEEVDLWWFSSAGVGVHERGSMWRSAIDFFDFERQSSKLEITFLHDKTKQTVSFEVVDCDDKPPFNVCLDVKEALRGKKRFYSFHYDDEMDRHVPWARAWRASAESRSRAAR